MYRPEKRSGRSQSFAYGDLTGSVARPDLPPHSQSTPSGLLFTGASPQLPTLSEGDHSSYFDGGSDLYTRSPTSPALSDGSGSGNQFVDDELLRGVTIGFKSPAIFPPAAAVPMSMPIPNRIELPYGQGAPLHVQALNWHDLLALMARLSNTALVPVSRAVALTQSAFKLRVVVNFVKARRSSKDWHVVVYMSIDYPAPEGHSHTMHNPNDPALLPYSYTLSPVPDHLRQNADSATSKWFSIPLLKEYPRPTLPISFPDLAVYLARAVEISRNGIAGERTPGFHRLAKAVDAFYPNRHEHTRSRLATRVRGLFGWDKAKRENDDRSNLVTPFWPDDFGR